MLVLSKMSNGSCIEPCVHAHLREHETVAGCTDLSAIFKAQPKDGQ